MFVRVSAVTETGTACVEREIPAEANETCKFIVGIVDRIGDKWTVMVVGVLADGPMRFNAILRKIGTISHRMLTLTLRGLERDGLVERRVYATIPPAVEYELTPLGRSLTGPLWTLAQWAQANQAEIASARVKFDDRPSSAARK